MHDCKKKTLRKYKVKAENRIHQAFIRSIAENHASRSPTLNNINQEHSHSSNDSISIVSEQCLMNINDETLDNSNIEYVFSPDRTNSSNGLDESDSHTNNNYDELDNIVTPVCQDEEQTKLYLLSELRKWGLRNVSKHKVDDILKIFNPIFPFLPKSYKTLLRTPYIVSLEIVGTGLMWHKKIRSNIEERIDHQYLTDNGQIVMDVNIDGIPLYKDSTKQFWPILGKFVGQKYPFIVGVYCGRGKPSDLEAYLHKYIVEVAELTENGYERNGTIFSFCIRNYILDAPARSFVKQCVPHNSQFACEKCTIKGEWFDNRMIFEDLL